MKSKKILLRMNNNAKYDYIFWEKSQALCHSNNEKISLKINS
jgi:hypothetical protein